MWCWNSQVINSHFYFERLNNNNNSTASNVYIIIGPPPPFCWVWVRLLELWHTTYSRLQWALPSSHVRHELVAIDCVESRGVSRWPLIWIPVTIWYTQCVETLDTSEIEYYWLSMCIWRWADGSPVSRAAHPPRWLFSMALLPFLFLGCPLHFLHSACSL